MPEIVDTYRGLSDLELCEQVQTLVARERSATTMLIAALAEFDSRRLYLAQGFSSTASFCEHALHLSEAETYLRIRAARVAQQFPIALELLIDGSLTLTNLSLLSHYLTAENHQALLHDAIHKTRREVEHQIGLLDPSRARLVTVVLKVAPETRDKLRRAQDLLQSTAQQGDPATVFDRALTMFVAHLERRKTGAALRPRRPRPPKLTTRHVPRALKRRVWRRDDGRCAFVGAQGRCPETRGLEYHHVVPFADGGPTTFENIELRCHPHNLYEAEVAGLSRPLPANGSPAGQGDKQERAG